MTGLASTISNPAIKLHYWIVIRIEFEILSGFESGSLFNILINIKWIQDFDCRIRIRLRFRIWIRIIGVI